MFRHLRRSRLAAAAAATATLVAGALLGPPAGAQTAPSFGEPVTVVAAGCDFTGVTGDAKRSTDGQIRGFVAFDGGTCDTEPVITYFRQSTSGWVTAASPYRGRVLAVAGDGNESWLLFANTAGIHLGRRASPGVFTAAETLSPNGLGGALFPTGDVIASAGQYWAVWSEQFGPGGEFAQSELFQALTLGSGHFHDGITRQQITNTPEHDDVAPTLTFDPATTGSTGRVIMIWNRNDGAQGLSSVLRIATAAFDGRWTSRQYTPSGVFAADPDLHTGPGTNGPVSAAYVSGERIVQATSPQVVVETTRFATPGFGPRTSVATATFTAWTSSASRSHVLLARTGPGVERFEVDITPTAGQQQLVAVVARDHRATVLGASFTSNRLYSIAQR